MPDSGNLWNMIGFGCPTAFILNNFKIPERRRQMCTQMKLIECFDIPREVWNIPLFQILDVYTNASII